MKAKYEKADANVTKVCQVLEGHQIQLMKDVAMMDKMYELNKNYYKELTMYLLAGRKRLEKAQQVELPAMMDQAARSGLPEDAQAVNDMQAMCTRFEKKLHDLELTRMISIQMAPQIRLVQS
ncbi:MAG: toxic anion resistance protein, partial [Eisenbergiella sp.]